MTANGFTISDTSYERALQTAEQDLRAMARARAVEEEIRFTKYRLAVSSDNWPAAARLRLLQDVLAGLNAPPIAAPICTQPKPRNGHRTL